MPSQYKFKKTFWMFSSASFGMIVIYVFLVFFTVSHTLSRENSEKSIQNILSNISEKESTYMSLEASITPDLATAKGFVDANNTIVVRAGATLTMRN